ncbi:MAG: hypothetical protein GQ559_00655 [Desulfobulbaceae bacterium]|nr:hypothetical protein [Desulfobulbaceae bacterium]
MHKPSIGSLSRSVLLAGLAAGFLLCSCATDRQMVPSYQGREQREAALQRQETLEAIPAARPLSPRKIEQVGEQVAAPPSRDVLMPVLTLINDRIFAYEQKLESWKEFNEKAASLNLEQEQVDRINACRQQLHDIFLSYNALHERILAKDSVRSSELLAGDFLLELEKKDINYLESDCTQLFSSEAREPTWMKTTRSKTLHEEEQDIRSALTTGNFEQVIVLYEKLPLESGEVAPHEATFAYGKSLMKTHREVEARKVFKDLLEHIRQQDQAQWEFRLMQIIGDLEFGLEVYGAAGKQYEEITGIYSELSEKNDWARQQLAALNASDQQSKEVKVYASLLLSYLGYNPDRDGFAVLQKGELFIEQYPYSPVASSADVIVAEAREQADKWFSGLLAEVDRLEAERKFQEALLRIERVPRNVLPFDKQGLLNAKATELTTAESIAIETKRLVQEQTLQEDWNTAMTYLEAKEYDQAIEIFTGLRTTSYEDKALSRIDEAARLAAREDRRRAAELFVRANRTHDLKSRKKLLFASRRLLQDILVKYPQSELTEKVTRNLSRIDEELNAIDPTLLSVPVTVSGAPPSTGMDQSGVGQEQDAGSGLPVNGYTKEINTIQE